VLITADACGHLRRARRLSLPMHTVITGEQGAHHCRCIRSSLESKVPITTDAYGHHWRARCPSLPMHAAVRGEQGDAHRRRRRRRRRATMASNTTHEQPPRRPRCRCPRCAAEERVYTRSHVRQRFLRRHGRVPPSLRVPVAARLRLALARRGPRVAPADWLQVRGPGARSSARSDRDGIGSGDRADSQRGGDDRVGGQHHDAGRRM